MSSSNDGVKITNKLLMKEMLETGGWRTVVEPEIKNFIADRMSRLKTVKPDDIITIARYQEGIRLAEDFLIWIESFNK